MKYKETLFVTRQCYIKHKKSFSNRSAYLNDTIKANAALRIANNAFVKQAEMNPQGCLVKANLLIALLILVRSVTYRNHCVSAVTVSAVTCNLSANTLFVNCVCETYQKYMDGLQKYILNLQANRPQPPSVFHTNIIIGNILKRNFKG
jgi:hypothetical protein